MKVSIVGGSGYVGGELLRLLLSHPQVKIGQVTSETHAGRYVHLLHPNLRGRTGSPPLQFVSLSRLEPCDLLFLALPHGEAQTRVDELARLATRLIDLSADFRLRDPDLYARWYGAPHAAPAWLDKFVYGLPELHRDELRGACYASGVGCNAVVSILAVWPLVKADWLDRERGVIIEVKVGSSEGGHEVSEASHHPERSHVVRSFAPIGHRHTAELIQELAIHGPALKIHFSATAVELVRGALATAHVFLNRSITERDLWGIYRETYSAEPFVRIVKERQGPYRFPEPKILAGSNYCDVGFALDEETGRVVAIAAIDNLMKGAAGTAVQCMNVMLGWDETMGLEFPGLHPV